MSEKALNSQEIPENFTRISQKEELYPRDEGFSWRKIPSTLFNLPELIQAKTNDVAVALAMANYTANTRHYPIFSIGRDEIARKTALSPRAISASIKFLALNNVISVRSSMGVANQYRWNEGFLKGIAQGSLGVVNEVHQYQCTTFTRGSERGAHIYIEFSLEIFISSFKEFFDKSHEDYKPYNFYIPGKRKKKGEFNDAASRSGSTILVEREDAWREAVAQVYQELQRRKFNDALVRIYLALRASKNIADVNFPKAALRFRVFDGESINEARSKSHIKEFLHNDEDFKDFINQKLSKGGIQ